MKDHIETETAIGSLSDEHKKAFQDFARQYGQWLDGRHDSDAEFWGGHWTKREKFLFECVGMLIALREKDHG